MALTTREASELASPARPLTLAPRSSAIRSEERRVGKECGTGGSREESMKMELALVGEVRLASASWVVAATASVKLASLFCFSGRRRHTRALCDWSSDVCASVLL